MAGDSVATASRGSVSVLDFGAVGDGSADDTDAMKRAHATGRLIYYPAGVYKFTSVGEIRRGGIVGDGIALGTPSSAGTALLPTDPGDADAFAFVGDAFSGGALFRDFAIIGPKGKKGGAGLRIAPDASSQAPAEYNYIQNVHIRNMPIGVDCANVCNFVITGLSVLFYAQAGIRLDNAGCPDQGDGIIQSSMFFNGMGNEYGSIGVGVIQHSGGGLKLIGNKFNGGLDGMRLDLTATTSDLIVTGNSFENAAGIALHFANGANSKAKPVRFRNIPVTANQFSGNKASDIVAEQIHDYEGSSYWDLINVTGNTFFRNDVGPSVWLAASRYFVIAGNSFVGKGGPAVKIEPSCRYGQMSNVYAGFAPNVDCRAADVAQK